MPNRLRPAITAFLALCAACHWAPPPQLEVVRRFVDERVRARPTQVISTDGFVGLADERRPALASAIFIRPTIKCPVAAEPPARHATCRVEIPRTAPRASGWILETHPIGSLRRLAKRAAGRTVRRTRNVGQRLRIAFPPRSAREEAPSLVLPAWLVPFSRAWAAPSIPLRDARSRPFVVAPGAVLTFAIGTEEPAWHVDAPAVEFTVEARHAGGVQTLYQRVIDPSHRPEDRRWHEASVPLTSVEGANVRIRMMVRPVGAGALAPQLPVWGDPTVLAPAAPTTPRRPSIVLVSLDTLRAKSMSSFGYDRTTTPFLERFAAGATRFSNTFTTYSNTFGAHMSMLTGALPSSHVNRGGTHRLSPEIDTLAERLRAAGYTTTAFTEDALLDATVGFERGFSHYWENKEIATGAGDAPGTFGRAIEWVRDHRDRPFFLFVHTYAVHAPYRPPAPYDAMFQDDARDNPTSGQRRYEQEIRKLDDDVAALVDSLDGLVDPAETLLVITADHGEEFGEHGGFAHVQLYDEVLHVPLFLRWPGRVPAGRTVDALTSLVDVTPTILDLVGLEARALNGHSLGPLVRGETGTPDRPIVLAESPPSIWSDREWSYVARTRSAKCFAFESRANDRCYDLVADPEEQRPGADSEAIAGLRQVARAFANIATKTRGGRPHGPTADPADPEPDPERIEKLRALGYVE